jgi:hypothetical protein
MYAYVFLVTSFLQVFLPEVYTHHALSPAHPILLHQIILLQFGKKQKL